MSKLRELLRGRSAKEIVQSYSADEGRSVVWLAKDQTGNPFCVDGYDCLSFVNSMISTTGDQRIAESFLSLRESEGSENIGQLPPKAIELACRLEYPSGGKLAEGALFKAAEMEQKWDIYLYGDRLYFCRSWTGLLTFVAELVLSDSAIVISRVWASGEDGAVNNEFALREVDYLVKSHVLGRRVPHPLPSDVPPHPDKVGLYSFSQYGNRCCFGTYEDTLPWEVLKR